VQETSPIAAVDPSSQGAQAGQPAAGTAAAQTNSSAQEFDCKTKPGYDVKIIVGTTPKIEQIPVCPSNEKSPIYVGVTYPALDSNGVQAVLAQQFFGKNEIGYAGFRCTGTNSTAKPAANWKCIFAKCEIVSSGRNGGTKTETCKYDYGENGGMVTQGKAGPSSGSDAKSIADAAAKGDPSAAQAAKDLIKADPSTQSAIGDAFSAKQADIEKQVNTLNDSYAELAKLTDSSLCQAQPGTPECATAAAQQKEIQNKIGDLTNQYDNLTKAKVALNPVQCEPGSAGCYNMPVPKQGDVSQDKNGQQTPPWCAQNNGYPGCPGYRPDNGNGTFDPNARNGNNAACQACQAGNQNACMQCAQSQGNGLGKMGQGGGGQKSGGGGGQQQQQCQPRYVCNGNAVMYVPCTNGGQGSAQMVQQCQNGYTCSAAAGSSNSSCQIQAQYGYCADGKTPRTAPAQQQPPASSCTSGNWQDTSNGCQTNWQCVSGTGQPTAQLSCQPTSATAGMTISLSYACAGGATSASTTGFTIPADSLSGTASDVVQKPTIGNTVTYGLSCKKDAATASAQCSVRTAGTSIVLIATPEKIQKSEADEVKRESTIGWVTTGMQSCVISSPDLPTWSDSQASITSVAGAVASPALTADTKFVLTCTTLGGTEASSTVKVLAI
jgi:hypothetical protein